MAKDLLFEIGLEEMPARFMEPALKQIQELTASKFAEAGLTYENIKTYGTPRRLTLIVEGLLEVQPDLKVESKGPAQKAAYDAEGKPSRALEGFCKGQGVTPEDLEIRELKGVPYVYAIKEIKGKEACDIVADMLAEVVHKLYFPKPMRWAYNDMRFARPIKWLILMLGAEVLPLDIAGVCSSNVTRGHRFLGSDHVEIAGAGSYEEALAKEFVIVDQAKRKEIIWAQIQEVAANLGGMVKENEDLLDEVVYILEYPTALAGNFMEKYLAIPEELIVTPMVEHQRYFPVYNADGTALLNNFITVRNGNSDHLATVAAGNEKVLTARLADAEFFWNEDCSHKLEINASRLETIVFHEKLGTLSQKVARMKALATFIAEKLAYGDVDLADTKRGADLMKCDLVSNAVYEFTELQGIMGEYYAHNDGETAQVATAIREHYLPRFTGDVLPETKAGIALALADRFDSLVGFFAQGMIPTGSQDPYALRRQAIGATQIILTYGLDLKLSEIIAEAYKLYVNVPMSVNLAEVEATLTNFFKQRLDNALADSGIAYDIVNAALALPIDQMVEAKKRAVAVAEFKGSEAGKTLMVGYTRGANLLKSAKIKDALTVDAAVLVEESEIALYEATAAAEVKVAAALAAGEYANALAAVGEICPQVDAFFENVMVMADDEAVKNNRLALLQKLVGMTAGVADFTKLVG